MGIWDTAGAERYHALGTLYHNGARAAIVCFDASNRTSWDKLKDWVRRCHTSPQAPEQQSNLAIVISSGPCVSFTSWTNKVVEAMIQHLCKAFI